MDKSKLFQQHYTEVKEHRLLRAVWCAINAIIFPLIGNKGRTIILKLFGARIDQRLVVYPSVKVFAPWNLEVHAPWAVIGPQVEVYNKARVVLGSHSIISQDSYLCTASHDVSSPVMAMVKRPIIIEGGVWVAARATVLPGVILHEGAVVGCSAVVTKDVAPWTVVGGNPPEFIKKRELRG